VNETKTHDNAVAVGADAGHTDTQRFVLNNLDQPLNRNWSVCLPQCVYWLAYLDEEGGDDDDTFFLLELEAVEAEDMVEDTEFDESFLLMVTRVGQRLVEADCGDCCEG
jgi:hypothetical protein